jgi:hypothetical protein
MDIKGTDIYIGIVHYPIKNKTGEVIATAVTNFDIHDIARLSRTFGFKKNFIITPIKEQQALVNRIVDHWKGDYGKKRNNKRSMAIELVNVADSIDMTIEKISQDTKKKVKIVATSARSFDKAISIEDFTKNVSNEFAYLLLFGTGWGLTDDTCNRVDYMIKPLIYNTDYNHLSVRSAVSIIMDRLYNG